MITPSEAGELIGRHVRAAAIESRPLLQCVGAILREEVVAERDQPPFDRVAMDGVAVQSSAIVDGGGRFTLQATQAAGDPPLTLASPRHCIEIMTGASLPAGCDLVVPVEQLVRAGGEITVSAARAQPYTHVHRRGSDGQEGAVVLRSGARLSAPEVAIAAASGRDRLRVSVTPRVCAISTGNELVPPGAPILPHQIRGSNAYGVAAALADHGLARVALDHFSDDEATLRRGLARHLEEDDVLILSGGVSAGRFDLVPNVLVSLGVQPVFHKISQRPGKPMWFGVSKRGQPVFALPGNPVAALVCLARYVIPALRVAAAAAPAPPRSTVLTAPIDVKVPLTCFVPVALRTDARGVLCAEPRPTNGSGDFTSLGGTDGFVELSPGPATYPTGFVAPFHAW